MANEKIKIPSDGEKISIDSAGVLKVPDNPIIGFIEGDGTGADIWRTSQKVLNESVRKAYGGRKKIVWMEIYAGEKAWNLYGKSDEAWLPQETLDALNEYCLAIKGPMTTTVGSGIRSINVALRQNLDLYACLRPVRWFTGVPSPVKRPEDIDMVIFRENSEDIYAGIEFATGTPEAEKILGLLKELGDFEKLRFPDSASFGIKPVSRQGTTRLVQAAIQYAIDNDRDSVTMVHKANAMEFTEGFFKKWGYEEAKNNFGATELVGGTWCTMKNPKSNKTIIIKDVIADTFLQQILTTPKEYSVIATMNLNGDYISDVLAAQVGGIGIVPGANINFHTGKAIFEATHGTAPKYAGMDKVNPSSLILSGEMMLRHLGWFEAADLIIKGLEKTISAKLVTFDFARLIEGAKELKCSEFGAAIIRNM